MRSVCKVKSSEGSLLPVAYSRVVFMRVSILYFFAEPFLCPSVEYVEIGDMFSGDWRFSRLN